MIKWWLIPLIGIFIIDVIYRTFIKRKIDIKSFSLNNITKTIIENDLPQNISDFEKDTYSIYDKKKFDANIINFHSRKKKDKKLKIKENKEDDDIVYPDNEYILDEDDIEFEGLIPKPKKRINITIEYDAKYKNLYNELSTQLDGNISYLNFYPKIIAIEGVKKIIKHILYISIFIIFLCMFFIEKIINLCCNGMNETLKGILSTLKYFLFGIIYVIIMYIVKRITHTNSFEVYINRKLKYSTLQKAEPPTYTILYNILKNID